MDSENFIKLSGSEPIAVDIETAGDSHTIRCVCFANKATTWTSDNPLEIQKVLATPNPKIGYNVKSDFNGLRANGYTVNGTLDDPYILARIMQTVDGKFPKSIKHQFKLKKLCNLLWGTSYITYEQLRAKYNKNIKKELHDDMKIPQDILVEYCLNDARITYDLYCYLMERISLTDLKVYNNIERPLIPAIADMEARGVKIDKDKLLQMHREFTEEASYWRLAIDNITGGRLNPNSAQEVSDYIYNKMGCKKMHKTSSGQGSVDEDALARLAGYGFDFPFYLLGYKKLTKMRSTFVDGLYKAGGEEGIIHCRFSQCGADTGRASASEPNLQQQPAKVRSCMVAREGHSLISLDYSQVELRVLAHMAKDEAYIKLFNEGRDAHDEVARDIFGDTEKEHRAIGKAINFSMSYGGSSGIIVQYTGIPRKEAEEYHNRHMAKHPRVPEFAKEMYELYKKEGVCRTMFGRERRIDEPSLRAFFCKRRNADEAFNKSIYNKCVNTAIQGTAADILKKAIVKVHEALKGTGAHLILMVHDELVIECPDDQIDMVSMVAQHHMENIVKLDVALPVDITIGKEWS